MGIDAQYGFQRPNILPFLNKEKDPLDPLFPPLPAQQGLEETMKVLVGVKRVIDYAAKVSGLRREHQPPTTVCG